MADSYVIETWEETAGIVILEQDGLRFYASQQCFSVLEGEIFGSVFNVRRAVDQMKPRTVKRGQRHVESTAV